MTGRRITRLIATWTLMFPSLVGAAGTVRQTQGTRCPPVCARYYVTYEGRVFVSFPNYDIALSGTPSSPNQFPRPSSAGPPRVIFKDERGMYWDGGTYFVHPAYRQDLVTRHYYSQRIVGSPHAQWPPVPKAVAGEPPRAEAPAAVPRVHAPKRSSVPLPKLPPTPLPTVPKKRFQ
jgi:hypothetical protein